MSTRKERSSQSGSKAASNISPRSTRSLQKAAIALEDAIWVLESLKIGALKEAAKILHDSTVESPRSGLGQAERKLGQTPNLTFLIGVLPALFQDRELFPQNDDITDFASSALGLEMNRDAKRSRYEIIGRVVCEAAQLKDDGLSQLVSTLEAIIGDKNKRAEVAKRRQSGDFSWNLAIQEIFRKS